MGGTFDEASFERAPVQYGLRVWNGGGDVGGACTLLGPEGPDAAFERWTNLWALPSCRLVWLRDGYRPYFENYTVDASIFETISVVS